MHQNQQLAQYDRASLAPFLITDPVQANLFNSWPPPIKWGPRQHPFLPPAHTGQPFQQLTPPDQMGASPALLLTTGSVQANLFNSWPFRSNEDSVSTPFYHRPIQINFFNSWPPFDQMGAPSAPLSTTGPYRSNFDPFQLK